MKDLLDPFHSLCKSWSPEVETGGFQITFCVLLSFMLTEA